MNKMLTALTLTTSLAALPLSALADSTHGKRYAALDIGFYSIEVDNTDPSPDFDADITHVTGRIGGYINDHLALEGRIGTGVTDDTSQGVDFSMRYMLGTYLRAGAKVTDQIFPYVLLGFTRADFKAEGPFFSENNAETDTSYGVGVDLNLSGLTLALEYANLVDKNDVAYEGFSIGLKSTF